MSRCKESAKKMFHLSIKLKNYLIKLWKEIDNLER